MNTDAGCVTKSSESLTERTVGQTLDMRIANARAEVERLCNLKAKAEALNILQYPFEFIQTLSW
jgi:hypothetical protein